MFVVEKWDPERYVSCNPSDLGLKSISSKYQTEINILHCPDDLCKKSPRKHFAVEVASLLLKSLILKTRGKKEEVVWLDLQASGSVDLIICDISTWPLM